MSADGGSITALPTPPYDPPVTDLISDPSSQPSSLPPSSIESSLPPSVEPTSIPPSSISSLRPSDSSSIISSSSSSSIEHVLTAPPPTPSNFSSDHPAQTVNFTTVVTSVSGQLITYTSALPTSLVADTTKTTSDSHRTAIIAGATSGLFVLLLLFLGASFAYRRHKLRRSLEDTHKKKEVRALLDGEEFDDDDVVPMSMRHHRDMSSSSPYMRSGSPAPSLLKSRTSESGSIFREEVWPPPGFVDPIHKRSSQVDLSKIVDDVMGPSPTESTSNLNGGPPSSWHNREYTDGTSASGHSEVSTTHSLAHPRQASYPDPFQSHSQQASSSTAYHSTLPPGASLPIQPGSSAFSAASHASSSHNYPTSSHSKSGPSTQPYIPLTSSSHGRTASQPKKSSPLARALSGDAKLWLGRHLHRPNDNPER